MLLNQNKLSRRIFLTIFFTTNIVFFVFCAEKVFSTIEIYREAINALQSNYYDIALINKVLSKKNISYCADFVKNNSYYDSIRCLVKKIDDPYTKFLLPQEAKKEIQRIKRTTTGLGISLDPLNPFLIAKVQTGSSADKANIQPNDQILAINGTPIEYINENEINSLLNNSSLKTKITLDLKRKYTYFSTIVQVEEVSTKSIRTKVLNNNIAYIKIDDLLPNNACIELESKLIDNSIKNSKGLILDLRGNKGGLLRNAVNISDYFMETGKIVIIKSLKGQDSITAKASSLYNNKPIVVLVDRLTASASEVIAAALRDNKKAIIIGQKTYGKGMIQKIYTLSDSSILHITVNEFFTPKGETINGYGIEPDIVIDEPTEQLRKALYTIERLTSKISKN